MMTQVFDTSLPSVSVNEINVASAQFAYDLRTSGFSDSEIESKMSAVEEFLKTLFDRQRQREAELASMLKYEGIPVGSKIKAYDFESIPGRPDRFIVGVIESDEMVAGAKVYRVKCTEDSVTWKHGKNRVGEIIYVPMEIAFAEYEGRVTVV